MSRATYSTTKFAVGVFFRSDAEMVVECTVPTNQPVAALLSWPYVQDRLADQLLPLLLRLERRDVLEDLPARRHPSALPMRYATLASVSSSRRRDVGAIATLAVSLFRISVSYRN